MAIERVSVIGLGALGVLFGHHLSQRVPQFTVIADQARIDRYQTDGIYCNGEKCAFAYVTPDAHAEPADLIIVAVKATALDEAVTAMRGFVGERTLIISLLNGISSEEVIGEAYGMDKLVYCVAQGMDAVKEGNRLTCAHMGELCIGDKQPGVVSDRVREAAAFLTAARVPHIVETQMFKKLWSKLMVNVGVNQVIAVFGGDYAGVQCDGERRELMIAAMREVMALSEKEGVGLGEDELHFWLALIGRLSPRGKPSMRQDVEARRYSELELFAGTVLRLGQKHRVATPVNAMLYQKMKEIESAYS